MKCSGASYTLLGGGIVFFVGGKCECLKGLFAICEKGVICNNMGGGGGIIVNMLGGGGVIAPPRGVKVTNLGGILSQPGGGNLLPWGGGGDAQLGSSL